MSRKKKSVLPFRAWYYFRIGYTTYLAFTLAVATTLVSVYYLAINNIPALKDVFPSFISWAITIVLIGVPLGIFLGWVHLKRSKAFSSEADIGVEVNPYYYKLPPGFWKEVLAPLWLETLMLNLKILNNEKLSDEELKKIDDLKKNIQHLIKGGAIGSPREF